LSTYLTPHPDGRGPSLHGRYAASRLLRPHPTSDRAVPSVMDSQLHFGARPQHVGPLRFLDLSLAARCPQPPRRAERLHMPVASSSVLASPSPEGWPLSSLRFEADIGFAFATAHSVRLAGLRRSGYPKPPPAQLHVSQAFHMASTFQLTREIRLSLTHRRRGETHGAWDSYRRAVLRVFGSALSALSA